MSGELTARQQQLIQAFVSAWEASNHEPFDLGSLPLEHASWPEDLPRPNRDEVRPLVHCGLLEVDERAAPVWRVIPTAQARELVTGSTSPEDDALADPERRLGLILEAAISAFEEDPSKPLHLAMLQQTDLVAHPHWPLQTDVVRQHDLEQLEQLGLISTRPLGERSLAFWPTPFGRSAADDFSGQLDKLADQASDEGERSRLRRWAARLRAGDFAVGTAAGAVSGAFIKALMGS